MSDPQDPKYGLMDLLHRKTCYIKEFLETVHRRKLAGQAGSILSSFILVYRQYINPSLMRPYSLQFPFSLRILSGIMAAVEPDRGSCLKAMYKPCGLRNMKIPWGYQSK